MTPPSPKSRPLTPIPSRRVLVTGASTPISRRLVQHLLADPTTEAVLAVISPRESDTHGFPDDPRLTLARLDLARSRARRELMGGHARALGLTTLVDAATHRSARRSTGPRARALNVDSTRELLYLAERHPTLSAYVYRSFGAVYQVDSFRPSVLDEAQPLNLEPEAPQWVRDRVEADLAACTRMGMSRLRVAVLRMAECPCPHTGSQLWDYLQSRVCFRPAGFDPMLDLISVDDAARALQLAIDGGASGVFNIRGADILPLSRAITLHGSRDIPVPGVLLHPLYAARSFALGADFRYDLNRHRFHHSAVLDGTRAAHVLGYEPTTPISWGVDTTAAGGCA